MFPFIPVCRDGARVEMIVLSMLRGGSTEEPKALVRRALEIEEELSKATGAMRERVKEERKAEEDAEALKRYKREEEAKREREDRSAKVARTVKIMVDHDPRMLAARGKEKGKDGKRAREDAEKVYKELQDHYRALVERAM